MAIRQQNSEPIERSGFFGCRILLSGDINDSGYCIWMKDDSIDEWGLDSVEEIDDLIDMLTELRKVDESNRT